VKVSLSVVRQCQLLGVSRSTYYNYRDHHEEHERLKKELFAQDKALSELVMDAWTKTPTYGYRKMSRYLLRNGHPEATEKRVRRIYQQLGLQGLIPQFKTTRASKRKEGKYPYLLRNRQIRYVNECWASDITYIKLPSGMVYFTAVIDLFSRKILAWRLSNTMDTIFCIECVQEAIQKYGIPAIFNTDMGAQYTSKEFITLLQSYDIRISMDGVGRCLDNVFIERTFRTLKYECIFLNDYSTMTELSQGLKSFVEFFNQERLHQGLDYQTPDEVYESGCFPVRVNDTQVA
jgi:putative transposase